MASSARLSHAALAAAALLFIAGEAGPLQASLTTSGASSVSARCEKSSATVGALEPVSTPAEVPMYAARGKPGSGERMVFLHGMCGRTDFAEALTGATFSYGSLLVPQGDVPCPDRSGTTWSYDLEALDSRVLSGLSTLGVEQRDDVILIGYSMGATRAEELARKVPLRYRRLILIGGPKLPSPAGLSHVEGVVFMAGERDRQDLMRRGALRMQAAGIPATFLELPGAAHGELGPDGERVLREALSWLSRGQPSTRREARGSSQSKRCDAVSLR